MVYRFMILRDTLYFPSLQEDISEKLGISTNSCTRTQRFAQSLRRSPNPDLRLATSVTTLVRQTRRHNRSNATVENLVSSETGVGLYHFIPGDSAAGEAHQ